MNMLLCEHIDHRVLVLAPAMPPSPIVLDDLVNSPPNFEVHAGIYDSLSASIARELNAC